MTAKEEEEAGVWTTLASPFLLRAQVKLTSLTRQLGSNTILDGSNYGIPGHLAIFLTNQNTTGCIHDLCCHLKGERALLEELYIIINLVCII